MAVKHSDPVCTLHRLKRFRTIKMAMDDETTNKSSNLQILTMI
jgi:hypothetical protein